MDRQKKGFTLIELLVVIAIIALLLSIVMPSLRMVKKKARGVICMSNLKQWGLIFELYVQNNDEKFYRAWTSTSIGHEWIAAAKPYYQDPKICFCPEAKKLASKEVGSIYPKASNQAWGRFAENDIRNGYANMAGSYGINDWVGNPAEGFIFGTKSMYWASPLQRGSRNAPLFLDAVWLGGMPMDTNTPPTSAEATEGSHMLNRGGSGMMQRYCVDRHQGNINAVFVNFSVTKVSLKRLWKLKWHSEFDTGNTWTRPDAPWPEWMKNFKE